MGASGAGGVPMGYGGDTALPAALSAALPHACAAAASFLLFGLSAVWEKS